MGVDYRNHLFAPALSPGWVAGQVPRLAARQADLPEVEVEERLHQDHLVHGRALHIWPGISRVDSGDVARGGATRLPLACFLHAISSRQMIAINTR